MERGKGPSNINLEPYEIPCATISNSASINLSYLVRQEGRRRSRSSGGEVDEYSHKAELTMFLLLGHTSSLLLSLCLFTRGFQVRMAKQDRRYAVWPLFSFCNLWLIHILEKHDLYTHLHSHTARCANISTVEESTKADASKTTRTELINKQKNRHTHFFGLQV